MGDCSSAGIRDALPELMFDEMDAARRAEVQSHVDTCAECAAELDLLKRVRRSAVAPSIDIDRVVRALPVPRGRSVGFQRPSLRLAAALALLIGGATWYLGKGTPASDEGAVAQVAAPPAAVTPDSSQVAVASSPPAVTRGQAKTATPATGLSLDGGLSDFSDAELRSLLATLDSFESTVTVEPRALEPVIELEEVR